jgi:hypothetical protein
MSLRARNSQKIIFSRASIDPGYLVLIDISSSEHALTRAQPSCTYICIAFTNKVRC